MPKRKVPLVNDEVYHIYNRSVAQQPIFRNKREYNIFTNLLEYYRFRDPPKRFSHYLRLNNEERIKLLDNLYSQNNFLVEIYAFCLMPNHYHLLLKQTSANGIKNFIRLFQNSYARYFNIKNKRFGSLFQSPFKAVRIETDEQFTHVARYIHLNPLTSYVLKDLLELKTYKFNSYIDYLLDNPRRFVNKDFLLNYFKNRIKFEKFTEDNLDYQRKLEIIKHITIE